MKFTKLHLSQFGPHVDTTLELANLTVIRGINASGKSHVEDALELTFAASADGTDAAGRGSASYIRAGEKKALIEVTAEFDGDSRLFRCGLNGSERAVVVSNPNDPQYSGGASTLEWLATQKTVFKCLLNNRYFISLDEEKQKNALASIILPKSYAWPGWVIPTANGLKLNIDWKASPYEVIKQGYKAAYDERTAINRDIKAFVMPTGDVTEADNLAEYENRLAQRRKELDGVKTSKTNALAESRIAQGKLDDAERRRSDASSRISREEQGLKDAEDGILKPDALKKHKESAKSLKKVQKIDAELIQLRAKVAIAKATFDAFGKVAAEPRCPTCNTELTEEVIQALATPLKKAYDDAAQAVKDAEKERKDLGDAEGAQKAMEAHERATASLESVKGRIRDEQCTISDIDANMDELRASAKAPDTAEFDAKIVTLESNIVTGQTFTEKAKAAATLRDQIAKAKDAKMVMDKSSKDVERMVEYFKTEAKTEMLAGTIAPFMEAVNGVLAEWGYRATLELEPYAFSVVYSDAEGKEYDIPIRRLSGSEKYRFATAFQVALAILSELRFVVVDAADIYDPDGRGILFETLMGAGLDQIIIIGTDVREEIQEVADSAFYLFTRIGEPGQIPTTQVKRLG